ncbi:MAG: hypothetical protein H7Y11_05490, partial [Armatimonadetes bacterium]|nr:hypothetical protein [Anaerolineae bacterium]
MSLRNRLLASYLLLLTLTLGVITVVLLLGISRQAEPPTTTYQQLFAIARRNWDDVIPIRFNITPNRRITRLDDFAATNNVRVLVGNTTKQTVSYDSADVYPAAGQPLNLRLDRDFNPQIALDRLPREAEITAGAFTDLDNVEWLFIGI